MISSKQILFFLALVLSLSTLSNAFTSNRAENSRISSSSTTMAADSTRPYQFSSMMQKTMGSTVIDAPTKEDVDRKTRRRRGDKDDFLGDQEENFDEALRKQGPLEWLEDMEVSRDMEDPFHILLLGQTFEKPKITVPYVASSLECKWTRLMLFIQKLLELVELHSFVTNFFSHSS